MQDVARIYLDNAATSWPKPESVYLAVERYQRELGAAAGRSVYREAVEVERLIGEARRRVAELLGAKESRRIVFAFNATDALNLALHGVLAHGDHVVTSVVEHNSVLRPLRFLSETRGVSVTHVPCQASGIVDPDEVRRAITPSTRLIALIHVSNVTGAIQPIAEFARLAKERELTFLVDAAQSLGHLPINVQELGIDLLAAPGHKGLCGPLGTGLLYIAPGVEDRLASLRQGGTGTRSDEDRQPNTMPDKFESGNLNVPGLVGLGAGVAYVQQQGVESLRQHDMELTGRLLSGLAEIPGVRVYGPRDSRQQVGVVSLTVKGYDPQEAAAMLDSGYGIQARAGLHCAPLMHKSMGTAENGGTLRLSSGPFTTPEHIDAALAAIAEIASSAQ